MSRITTLFAALSLTAMSAVAAAPVAAAQAAKVVVIDQARIMRDSAAGQDIRSKVQTIEQAMESELQPQASAIQTEQQSLTPRLEGKNVEDLRADPTLAAEVNAFVGKTQQFETVRQVRSAELQLTERKAWSDFFAALRPVLREVVEEQGADIVLDRQEVVYAGPTVDITADVITKLDVATPSISVVRQTLPERAPAQ
ncbi:MAG: OmpH family outer membrane protein [Pseudomonadota bacterium]